MAKRLKMALAAVAAIALTSCASGNTNGKVLTPATSAECAPVISIDNFVQIPASIEIVSPEEIEANKAKAYSATTTGKFLAMSLVERARILSRLHAYTFSTYQGEVLQSIFAQVSMPIERLPGMSTYSYNSFKQRIFAPKEDELDVFRGYLRGSLEENSKAHEYIHHIHHESSRWREFENFLGKFVEVNETGDSVFQKAPLSNEDAAYFAEHVLNNRALAENADAELDRYLSGYIRGEKMRRLIYEVDANMAVFPFFSTAQLRDLFEAKDYYLPLLEGVNDTQFNALFGSRLKAAGFISPIEAAKIAGANADSVERYAAAVEAAQKCYGISDNEATGRGLLVQQHKRNSLLKISSEALSLVE